MFVRRDMTASNACSGIGGLRKTPGLRWLLVLLAGVSAVALADPNLDAMQWLQKIQQAAQKLNYSGTFVYLQQGGQPQTSRVTHMVEGGVEKERLEMLEGAPVVVVRTNDEVRSYLPDSKTVLIEKRRPRPGFPALVANSAANSLSGVAEQYNVRKWDNQRIAGLDCQVLLLEPKDGLRYTHKLWADMNTGLLLKAQAFNEKSEVVEQIAFTQVEIGGIIEKYQAKLSRRDGGKDWRQANAQVWDTSLAEAGWKIEPGLPGFRKVSEMRRDMTDGSAVGQVVFSDGLTSVSVFVEPARESQKMKEGVTTQGAVNVYRRKVANYLVTVLGEAPPACVTRIAKAVEFKPVQASSNRNIP
jgi:sigma-E factor negative regulatory protein RseB